ncbi:MAG: hypothetical protein ACK5NW_14810 [Ottowia sp.]
MSRWALILALACTVGLVACADPSRVTLGTPAADVLHSVGAPTGRYALSGGGERLQYSSQPSGQTVVNVDVNAAGQVVRVEQALNEGLFGQRIQPNTWTRADVLREYGSPAQVIQVHNFVGHIWVWRYLYGPTWRLLYIDIGPDGVVRGWSNGDENMPDPPDPR